MNKVNYQLILDKTLAEIEKSKETPSLLLHSCCAPCSSYCIEYLSNYFNITIFYYNPNIEPEEFVRRYNEQCKFVNAIKTKNPVKVIKGRYNDNDYYDLISGHELDEEGGERCTICYRMRLEESAKYASINHFDYFTTTLSISPMKDAERLNLIGSELSKEYNVKYLFSDFKKRNGYLRSIELSKEYSLYRQDYCGCVYSK